MSDLVPIECEARLMGLSKARRKDGDWVEVKFHIHPDDHPHALFILPLGTDCTLSIKGTEEITPNATDTAAESAETPSEEIRPKGGERAKRAGILCNDPAFRRFLDLNYKPYWNSFYHSDPVEKAAACVRAVCDVKSRADLDHDEGAGEDFDRLASRFYASQRGDTEEARLAQRDRT